MSDFFFGAMIVSFIIIFIGVFSPQLALSFLKDKYQKRIYAILIFGSLTLVSFLAYQTNLSAVERADIKVQEENIAEHVDYYNTEIDLQLERIKVLRSNMAQILSERQERETDEDWTLSFNAVINSMEILIEDAKYLEAPKEYEEAHKLYLKAIGKLSSMPENMPDVIANTDVNLFRSIREDEQEALEYLDEFVDIIHEIRKQERWN